PTTVRPLVRFEGLPGEFSQHDFGQVDVRFLDGARTRVRFFASRLKYSRWVGHDRAERVRRDPGVVRKNSIEQSPTKLSVRATSLSSTWSIQMSRLVGAARGRSSGNGWTAGLEASSTVGQNKNHRSSTRRLGGRTK